MTNRDPAPPSANSDPYQYSLLRATLNRDDVVLFDAPWGKPSPGHITDLRAALLCHVGVIDEAELKVGDKICRGTFRIGAYTPDATGHTRFAAIDIDGAGHANAVKDPQTALRSIQQALAAVNILNYAALSRSGKGFHVWVFLEEPCRASDVRSLLVRLIPPDIELARGGYANPVTNAGVEVFPKSGSISPGGYGTAVFLPYYRGGSPLLERVGDDLQPVAPETVQRVPSSTLLPLLAKTMAPERSAVSASATRAPTTMATWRAKAVAKIELEQIFGPYLTGKKRDNGWLECRDPSSPSGDRHPSAAVADTVTDRERGTFHSFRTNKSCDVFEALVLCGKARTVREAFTLVAKLVGEPLPAEANDRPAVFCGGRQLRETIRDAQDALLQRNAKKFELFRLHGGLARLSTAADVAVLEPVTPEWLFGWFAAHVDWFRSTKLGDRPTKPDRDVVRTILESPSKRLPSIRGVCYTPFFNQKGRLIAQPGYHATDEVYYAPPPGWRMPDVPARPTPRELNAARELFKELLCDFPFVDDADLAHTMSAFLTPLMRRLFGAPVPLHLFEAPTPGTGKSMLCQLIALVVQGSKVAASVFSANKEEQRKAVFAALLQGLPLILLDNVDGDERSGRLESEALASVLTGDEWSDRLLGASKRISVSNDALWLMTGNNPQVSMELARRAVRCRLDAKTEDPWRGRHFRLKDILGWTREHRPRLVHALLTIIAAWLAADRPEGKATLGSFEAWSRAVGGALEVAGIHGFLGNLDDFYDEGDAESAQWREFVQAWWEAFGTTPKSASELHELAGKRHLLPSFADDTSERRQLTRLGIQLRKQHDRVYAGKRITRSSDRERPYRLEDVPDHAETTSQRATPASRLGTSSTSPTSLEVGRDEFEEALDDVGISLKSAPPSARLDAFDGDESDDPEEWAEYDRQMNARSNDSVLEEDV